jgi:hypothetical protein
LYANAGFATTLPKGIHSSLMPGSASSAILTLIYLRRVAVSRIALRRAQKPFGKD